jgi:hypothetical protein
MKAKLASSSTLHWNVWSRGLWALGPLCLGLAGALLYLLALRPAGPAQANAAPRPLQAGNGLPGFNTKRMVGGPSDTLFETGVGDLDGDGDLDLVSNGDERAMIYKNDGAGNFNAAPATGYALGQITDIEMGDFDLDGDLDFVAGGLYPSIYINDGAGVFSETAPHSIGMEIMSGNELAVGDLNGDGYLDVVVGQSGYIAMNDGVYPWSDPFLKPFIVTYFPAADYVTKLALGDVDGDGDLDIITAGGPTPNSVYLNDGAGNFYTQPFSCDAPPPNAYCYGTPAAGDFRYSQVVMGDVDRDTDLDIVEVNAVTSTVYLNLGGGIFTHTQILPSGNGLVDLADMDADGDQDILFGDGYYGSGNNRLYFNDGTGNFTEVLSFGQVAPHYDIAAADLDGDGDLDIIASHGNSPSYVILNDGSGTLDNGYPVHPVGISKPILATGDLDGDDDADIIAGQDAGPALVYFNTGGGAYAAPVAVAASLNDVKALALGDLDGDGDLDLLALNLVTLNDYVLRGFYNNGAGSFPQTRNLGAGDYYTGQVTQLVLGDFDNDGDLDVVHTNRLNTWVMYNYGNGDFAWTISLPDPYWVGGNFILATGDMDNDGDLDLVGWSRVGVGLIYLNDGNGGFGSWVTFGGQRDFSDLALGDLDGDGDLDVAATTQGLLDGLFYLNDGQAGFSLAQNFDSGSNQIEGVALGDWDGDGDQDIVSSNLNPPGPVSIVYLNNGSGQFPSQRQLGNELASNSGPAVLADVNGDGNLDAIAWHGALNIYRNVGRQPGPIRDNPSISVIRPTLTANANFQSAPQILGETEIPIRFTLTDPEGETIRCVKAYYSLNGGGHWRPAIAAAGTATTNLPAAPGGTVYTYTWNTFASGLFGQSNEVVFRIEAYLGQQPYTNTVSGPYQWPYVSATTFPFRVRGTQVRVMNGALPGEGAVVYRIPAGQTTGGTPLGGYDHPYRTDAQGYLPGRGALALNDTLVAMLPMSTTSTYVLYATNITPTLTGLQGYIVTGPGVQTVPVSAARPLLLFNLTMSLQWDARNDARFLGTFEYNLQRTSELLYDWSNGQAALGTVTVYHNREHWDDAHIRVYASNRLRPSALKGGIVTGVLTDTNVVTTTYYVPGQVHMGAVWNRYGEPGNNLSDDWPRTLAHELGHYALFQDDNYLGLDASGWLIPVDTCPSAMSDPYRQDYPYDEFHPDADWPAQCATTLSNQTTGRSDWATIATFYPWLNQAPTNEGPALLPLDITKIAYQEPAAPDTTLEDPTFYLLAPAGGRAQPGSGTRAFLYQDGWAIDLGRPTFDHILARGVRPGDVVCVYELAAERLGCETVSLTDEQLQLTGFPGWQPDITITPVNSRTLTIEVGNVPAGLALQAQLHPLAAPAEAAIPLTQFGAVYSGTFNLATPMFEGAVRVWVDEPAPRREAVTDYAIGGNPVSMRGSGVSMRGSGVSMRGSGAPVMSPDGSVILYVDANRLAADQFYTLQAVTEIPAPLPWATVVGRAYRLSASAGTPNLTNASINVTYMSDEVPVGGEPWLRLYFWDGAAWQQLPTTLDAYQNSATAPSQGAGLYVLMSSIAIPLSGPGWNLIAYPLMASQPVTQALLSIDGYYTTVYGWDAEALSGNEWLVYNTSVPRWVNDLEVLEFGHGYWIQVTDTITLYMGMSAEQSNRPEMIGLPPATYYGTVQPGPGGGAAPGMVVTAWVDGRQCGQATTRLEGGQVVYAIKVLAAGAGAAQGCGLPGKPVSFRVNGQVAYTAATWDNEQVFELPLALTPFKVFLPFVLRRP